MSKFSVKDAEIEGVKIITPFYMQDNRGYFLKSYERDVFRGFGFPIDIYEDFESYSGYGVIRGLHFQTKNPQIKLVRCIRGSLKDVIVDLRKDSPSFGKYIAIELSEENHLSVWIPAGFAHGFQVTSQKGALMDYKCVGKYLAGYDTGIRWNDEELNINWDISIPPRVSEKDAGLPSFGEFCSRFSGL